MALKAVLENLDGIEEGLQEHYAEQDGKFVLQLDEFGKHPGNAALKASMNRLDKDKKDLAAKLATAESRLANVPDDFDADEYLSLKAASSDPDKKKQATDEHLQSQRALYERRIADMEKKHAEALAAKDQEVQERDGYIDRSVGDERLRVALREVGVAEEYEDGAFSLLRPSVKVQRAETGDRSPIVETDMGEVDVQKFVKEWAHSKGKPYLRKETGPDAKGGNARGIGSKTINRKDFEAMDPAAQKKAVLVDKLQVVSE